jgi:hypothetical protein
MVKLACLAVQLQHHRLPAAQTGGPPANVPPQTSRIMEAFDIIKSEYDSALAEVAGWKAQRDEYEGQRE